MQVISQLVSFNPDQGRLHNVSAAVELLHRHIKLAREPLLQLSEIPLPEWTAAADDIFPKAGLGFMNTHGSSVTQGGADQLLPDILLIQRVSALMDRSEQGARHIILQITGRNSYIPRAKSSRKRMDALIQTSGFKVITHLLQYVQAEILLCRLAVILA